MIAPVAVLLTLGCLWGNAEKAPFFLFLPGSAVFVGGCGGIFVSSLFVVVVGVLFVVVE